MNYHPVVKKIIEILKENKFWFETFEHEPVRTSEEAAKIRQGYTLHQGAKAIIVNVKLADGNTKFAMLVIPGDLKFKSKLVKKILNAKDVIFANEEDVKRITDGVLPGGVPPFGNVFHIDVIVDPLLLKNEKIIFNAGDRCFSIGMKSEDYQQIVKPQIASIT